MNWDKFENDPFYSQILTYWYDEWNSISGEVKNGMIGIDIVNIRVVLLDIINEYELNQFKSDNNRKVYIKLIQTLLSKKYINIFREELSILKEMLEKKDIRAVYVISNELSNIISEQSFAQVLFDEVLAILEKKLFQKEDRLKIKELTNDIIIDLITLGMDIDDVRKFTLNIFRSYRITSEDSIHIIYDGVPEQIDTNERKKEYIDNLSIQNRLDFFRKKLLLEEKEFMFIYPIWGMNIIPQNIDDDLLFGCKLYNPSTNQLLRKEDTFDETFDTSSFEANDEEIDSKDMLKYKSSCNASIVVTSTSLNSARKIAKSNYSNLLNILNFYFANKNEEFFWDGQHIGTRVDESLKSFSVFLNPEDDRQMRRNISKDNPMMLNNENYEDIKKVSQIIEELEKRDMFYEANTILSVIDIMSKAKWQTEENKLLNYWIAIESLASISKKNEESKFNFIKDVISNIYFLEGQYNPLVNLFDTTSKYAYKQSKNDDRINIPNEFLNDVGFFQYHSVGTKIDWKCFYKRFEELKNYIKKESFLDEIEDTSNFYNNNKEALKQLRVIRNKVELTIDYIYKCRNQIVHNGYIDKNLVPYLVNFSGVYANSLFEEILNVYRDGKFDLQNHFIKEIYNGSLLEKKLSSKNFYKINLFE